jgi:hypothetical protein
MTMKHIAGKTSRPGSTPQPHIRPRICPDRPIDLPRIVQHIGDNLQHPGTYSNADYTIPAMGESYRGSDEIYRRIIDMEESRPTG